MIQPTKIQNAKKEDVPSRGEGTLKRLHFTLYVTLALGGLHYTTTVTLSHQQHPTTL